MKLNTDKYKAFFFDFDGVIVDSVNVKTDTFAEIYRPYGEKVVSQVISHHISHGGISRYEKFRYYHESFLKKQISEAEVEELAQKFSNLVTQKVIEAPFISGAPEFLELVKAKNKKLFVISATPENEIKEIVKQKNLTQYFTDIKGSPLKKDKNLKFLIDTYNLKISECIYFGDSEQDLNAAVSLNITFVPINYHDGTKGYSNFFNLVGRFEQLKEMR